MSEPTNRKETLGMRKLGNPLCFQKPCQCYKGMVWWYIWSWYACLANNVFQLPPYWKASLKDLNNSLRDVGRGWNPFQPSSGGSYTIRHDEKLEINIVYIHTSESFFCISSSLFLTSVLSWSISVCIWVHLSFTLSWSVSSLARRSQILDKTCT